MKPSLHKFLYQSSCDEGLRHVIMKIARASKYVAHAIRTGDLGKAGTSNLYGEDQLALDVLSDQVFCDVLAESDLVASFASEEQDEQVQIRGELGKYSVAFDPLDGSSLVDTNGPVGSVFGVWEGQEFIGKKGSDLSAAGYFLYGPRTTFILALNGVVTEFTLNDVGEYHVSLEEITLEPDAKIFAPGNLRAISEREDYGNVLNYFLENRRTLRYAGGMVPDVNSILLKSNGIFTYPSHSDYPDGKLRLLYECAPIAYIMRSAGGKALTEKGEDILDIECTALHERVTIIAGSMNEVDNVIEILSK